MPARAFPETYRPPLTLSPVETTDNNNNNQQQQENRSPTRAFPETYQPPISVVPEDETEEERTKRLRESQNPRDQPDTLQDLPPKEELETMLNERFPACEAIETNIDKLRVFECPEGKKPVRLSAPHGIVRCACVPRDKSDPWDGTSHKEISAGNLLRTDKPTWGNYVYFSNYPCDQTAGISGGDTGRCEIYKTTEMLFVEAAEAARDADAVSQYLEQKVESNRNPLVRAQPTPFTAVIEAIQTETDPEVLREIFHAARQEQKFGFAGPQLRLLADLQLLIGNRAPQIDLPLQDLLDGSDLEFPDSWEEYKAEIVAEQESVTEAAKTAQKPLPKVNENEDDAKEDDSETKKSDGLPIWAIVLIALASLLIVIAIIAAIVRSLSKPNQSVSQSYIATNPQPYVVPNNFYQ